MLRRVSENLQQQKTAKLKFSHVFGACTRGNVVSDFVKAKIKEKPNMFLIFNLS